MFRHSVTPLYCDGECGETRTGFHILGTVWVDDLVPKRPEGEIGALRNENELVGRGLAYDAAVHRPETS